MGNRLHYHKTHVIEYGDNCAFNWAMPELFDLLAEHDCAVYADNTDDPNCPDEFSVPFEDVEHLIDELKELAPDAALLEKSGAKWTAEEVIAFFQEAYDNADKENSDIYFSWF